MAFWFLPTGIPSKEIVGLKNAEWAINSKTPQNVLSSESVLEKFI